MIKFKEVSFSYTEDDMKEEESVRANYIIKDFNLQIKKGEFLAVLGCNGCGKSTIAKHMNALITPTEGVVSVDRIDTSDPGNTWAIRSKVGMVFQNPDNQLVASIIEEDIAFGPENFGVESQIICQRVHDSLAKVGMLEYQKHASHFLSGGQKQRIAIAGILAVQPKCIVLDEPTAMLDPAGRKEVLKIIKNLNQQHGITVVLITHYMDEAAQADRVVVMDKGHIKLEGTPREIFSKVQLMKKVGLDVPQVTELAYELRKEGIDIDETVLNVEEVVKELCRLKQKI